MSSSGRRRSVGCSRGGYRRLLLSTRLAFRLDVLTETWPDRGRYVQWRRVRCGARAEEQDAKEEKQRGGADLEWSFGKSPAEQMANRHRQTIGENHPEYGPQPHGQEARRLRCQHGRCELRLVTHLGEKEGHGHGYERRPDTPLFITSELVPSEGPKAEPDERQTGRRAEHAGWHDEQRRAAHDNGERMVEEGGDHDAPEDGAKGEPSGERQGEELGLVAHLGCPDEAERREEESHGRARRDSTRSVTPERRPRPCSFRPRRS